MIEILCFIAGVSTGIGLVIWAILSGNGDAL